ncbi:MAG: hypothetical protein WD802_04470 [Gemmatimonadaceae bacterium]
MRRALITDDLIEAVQNDALTPNEYQTALWVLRASDWKLQGVIGISTDLLNKMLAASQLLSSDILAASPPLATHTYHNPEGVVENGNS